MLKKLQLIVLLTLWISSSLLAQKIVLTDEFDNGDGLWNSGWIDTGTATVTVSVDNTGKLSGANSYKLAIVKGGDVTYKIQRNANCPLVGGNQYTLSFMAVADKDVSINALFEISGDPYTKYLNEIAEVTTTPQTFTYSVSIDENVPTNMVKLHFGGPANDNSTIWVDAITVTEMSDPTLVALWGKTSSGTAWPILNDASTAAGNGSMGNDNPPTGWATIRGEFATLQATTSEAVVVSGKLQFVGGGGADAYTHLRYALTFQDSTTLNYALTDTATWVSTKGHYGYGFQPRTGKGTMANGRGGVGTLWLVDGGGFNSGWGGNNTAAVGINGNTVPINQQPRNAEMIEGTYNFAISVKMIDDTTNEIKWYLVEENNKYWYGGSQIVKAKTNKFNGICFGLNNDSKTKQFNVMSVRATLGDHITVPEAPWEAYYVDQWGKTSSGTAWPILNDSETIIGDATMGDGSNPPTGWATIRGGFGQDLPLKTDKELIVRGQLEFVGGGGADAYTHFRYAMTYQDSSTLQNALTDSATWVSTKGHYGYGFQPRTGKGTMANGRGGVGTLWLVDGGGFNSGWGGNNTAAVGINGNTVPLNQQPRNAEMIEGTYNFAISVKMIDDTTSQLKWYLVEKNNKYWYGGTEIVKSKTSKYNGVCFALNNDSKTKQFKVIAAQVDYGTITVPEAPWQAYYVDLWGKTSSGTAWPILNDSETIVGDATMGDGSNPPTGWATMRGGFGQDLPLKTDKELIVKGQLEFVGGGGVNAYTHFRYAMTYQDSATLNNALTDSATWVSTKGHYGYGFQPRTGNGTMANGRGGVGTLWLVDGGGFNSGWGGNNTAAVGINGNTVPIAQAPRNVQMIEGTYDFAISVKMINDTTSQVKWYLVEKDKKYWYGGNEIVKSKTKKYNGVCFGLNNDSQTKQFKVIAAQVDYGTITVPKAPWAAYYLTQFGFYGHRTGGWKFTPGEMDGNATISGSSAIPGNQWSAVRADFSGALSPINKDTALVVSGKLEFVGGGFEAANSLRFGLFNSASPGTLVTSPVDATSWNGIEDLNTGYLFIPPSGTNTPVTWIGASLTDQATFGGVVEKPWLSTSGDKNYPLANTLQTPSGAIGSAGVYDFKISVAPQPTGEYEVKVLVEKADKSYRWAAAAKDNHIPVAQNVFNSIIFALGGGNTTTTLNILDIKVDLNKPLDIVVGVETEESASALPTEFALSQNYPNPFNPTTTIEFALPQNSNVKLVVYDVLGRVVEELVNSDLSAGYHRVNFNASNLASGIYFYTIQAGDYTNVKKLILLK